MLDHNETFQHRGYTFRVQFEPDNDHGFPWDEEDGHIVGIRAARRNDFGEIDKRPGERTLYDGTGRYTAIGNHLVYDFVKSLEVARRDGWDAKPYGTGTPRQRAERAVLADAERMRAWCANDWSWVGAIVERLDEDGDAHESQSLWGVESDAGDYLEQVARELADECIAEYEGANEQPEDIARTMRACMGFGNNDTTSPAIRAGQAEKRRGEMEYQSWVRLLAQPQASAGVLR